MGSEATNHVGLRLRVCIHVCMNVCIYVSKIRQECNRFPEGAALIACAVEPENGVACQRWQKLGRLCAQQCRSSGSKEKREHQWEVHRQRVRLIQQQKSDNHRSQSLGLAERSAELKLHMYSIPTV